MNENEKEHLDLETPEMSGEGEESGSAQDSVMEDLQPGESETVSLTEHEELKNMYRRLAADFENFRRRNERQNQEMITRASQNLIGDLLPVIDGFCLALATTNQDDPFVRGMQMIYHQLEEILFRNGLACIPGVGCEFDPALHEAIGFVASDEHQNNTVVEEVRRGYLLAGRVLRPSMVKVSKTEKEDKNNG